MVLVWPLGLIASVSDPWLTKRWELSFCPSHMTIFNNIPLPNSFYSDIASAGMRSNWCCAKDKSSFFLIKFCPNSIYPRSPIIPSKQITSIDLFWFLPAGSLAKTYFGIVQIFVEFWTWPKLPFSGISCSIIGINCSIIDTRILIYWLAGSETLAMWWWRLRIPTHSTNSPDSHYPQTHRIHMSYLFCLIQLLGKAVFSRINDFLENF